MGFSGKATRALAVALVLTAAACGSSSKSSSKSTSTTGASKKAVVVKKCPKPGADAIKVMVIVGTGTTGAWPNWPDVVASAKAAGCSINQQGGVGGKLIDVLYCNEQNEANAAAACGKKAADEKAAAVIGQFSAQGSALMDALEAANIPSIGMTSAVGTKDLTSKMSFNFDSTATSIVACPAALKAVDAKKMGFYGPSVDAAAQIIAGVKLVAKNVGLEMGDVVTVPIDTADYAPGLQQIGSSGADSLTIVFGEATTVSVLQQNAGKMRACFGDGSVSEQNMRKLGTVVDGTVEAAQLPTLQDTQVPDVAEYLTVMKAANARGEADTAPADLKSTGFRAFLDAKVVADLAGKIQGPVTNESLLAQLNKTTDLSVAGLTVDFTKPQTIPGLERVFNANYHFQKWDAAKSRWVPYGTPVNLIKLFTGPTG